MPSGSLLVVNTCSRASGRTSPHSTVQATPDYCSAEEEDAEATIEQVARSHETKLVRATHAIPVRQKTKAPAPRTQPILLAADVRFEESSQAIDTGDHQESASLELLLQTRTLDMRPS